MSNRKLTDEEVLEEACCRRGGVSPAVQAAYDKYKHLDHLFSDVVWMGDDMWHSALYDCWQAIKAHVEGDAEGLEEHQS